MPVRSLVGRFGCAALLLGAACSGAPARASVPQPRSGTATVAPARRCGVDEVLVTRCGVNAPHQGDPRTPAPGGSCLPSVAVRAEPRFDLEQGAMELALDRGVTAGQCGGTDCGYSHCSRLEVVAAPPWRADERCPAGQSADYRYVDPPAATSRPAPAPFADCPMGLVLFGTPLRFSPEITRDRRREGARQCAYMFCGAVQPY